MFETYELIQDITYCHDPTKNFIGIFNKLNPFLKGTSQAKFMRDPKLIFQVLDINNFFL